MGLLLEAFVLPVGLVGVYLRLKVLMGISLMPLNMPKEVPGGWCQALSSGAQ